MRISDWSSDVCSSDLFDDLRNIADCRIEHLEPGFAMLGSAQAHEDRKVETERTGVEDRDAPRDHSAFLEPLDPPPASILRHIGLCGDGRDRERRSLLKQSPKPSLALVPLKRGQGFPTSNALPPTERKRG